MQFHPKKRRDFRGGTDFGPETGRSQDCSTQTRKETSGVEETSGLRPEEAKVVPPKEVKRLPGWNRLQA